MKQTISTTTTTTTTTTMDEPKLIIITNDNKQIPIVAKEYSNSVFYSAYLFKINSGQPLTYKVEETEKTMKNILDVICGKRILFAGIYEDEQIIQKMDQYLPNYEPNEDLEDEEEDFYDYTDPYEIPKKKGPNYQEPLPSDDEEDFEEFYGYNGRYENEYDE